MARSSSIPLWIAFALLMVLGGQLGDHIRHLRQSEAFYRWILAAGVNESLLGSQSDNQDYRDQSLWQKVRVAAEPLLPAPETAPAEGGSKLGQLAREVDAEPALFALARGKDMAPLRGEFLQMIQERRLEFAKGITYAEAQQGGVNIFNLFFGFRKVAANFVWLQVDRYWHQGYMQRMIPLMQTCVLLDPNFVDAYLLGSWHLAYNVTAKMQDTPDAFKQWHPDYKACVGEKETYYFIAVEHLKNGIRNNPREYRLYFDLGFMVFAEKLKNYGEAVKYLQEAVRQKHERWVPRTLYKCLEKNGQYEEARLGWDQYIQRFEGTIGAEDVGQRSLQRLDALVLEKKGREASATDEAAAEAYFEQASKIWREMDEPYANGRLQIIEARSLAKKGRYIEAVALLELARWESGDLFEECSDLIIEYKNRGNLPLSVSEQKAVIRKEEGARCVGQPEPGADAA